MEINELLQKPLKDNGKNIQEAFNQIAKDLIQKFCIQCGETNFYLAEFEFYYYEETLFNQKWNEITYERIGYKAGDLFYHLSGMDICFDSHLSKDKGKKVGYGGGVLIRSVVEENGDITVGPLTCVNKMLNKCKGGDMPKLVLLPKQRNCIPKQTYRFLGQEDFKVIPEMKNIDGELQLAYFDPLTPEAWNKARSSYYKNRLIKYNSF